MRAQAAVSVIAGRVTDAETHRPLAGSIVTVEGTKFRATTKWDGTYRIPNVPAGVYTVRVRRLGFAAKSSDVTLGAEGQVSVDLAMVPVPAQLNALRVMGSLNPAEAKTVPAAVSVVTADEIEARGIVRTEDIFKTIPGVTVLSTGQWNLWNSVTVRGGTSFSSSGAMTSNSPAKILVDGVEIHDYDLAQIDPATMERVEILRGPQSSTIYGAAATGGLISVTTKKGEYSIRKAPRIEAKIGVGYIESRNRYAVGAVTTDNALAITGGGRDFSYRVGGGLRTQGNWTELGYETSPSAFGGFRLTQGALLLETSLRYFARDFGVWYNPEVVASWPSVFAGYNVAKEEDVAQSTGFSVHASYLATPTWRHELSAGLDARSYVWYSTQPKDTLGTQYLFNESQSKLSIKYHTGWDRNLGSRASSSLILGGDYDSEQGYGYYWEGIGDPNPGGIPAGGATSPFSTYVGGTAVYAQEVVGVGDKLFFTLGLRADHRKVSDATPPYSWSPRVGVAYSSDLSGGVGHKIRASYGAVPSSLPADALQEQYSGNRIIHANRSLKPPRLTGGDVGLEVYFGRRASLVFTYFDQKSANQIDLVTLQGDSSGFQVATFQNIGTMSSRGFELDGRVTLGRVTLDGTYSPIRGRITRLSPGYTGALVIGDRLAHVPGWTASMTAALTLPKWSILLTGMSNASHLDFDILKLYTDAQANRYDPANDRKLYTKDYAGFTKFSLSATHDLSRRLQGYLVVTDLFNTGAIEVDDFTINKARVSQIGIRIRQ